MKAAEHDETGRVENDGCACCVGIETDCPKCGLPHIPILDLPHCWNCQQAIEACQE